MDNYCRNCGNLHVSETYPKKCTKCHQLTWINPTPVAVLLQPVTDGINRGVLIGQRSIAPGKGEWNLPGGYVDPEDLDIIDAARRELWEETGFHSQMDHMSLFWSYSDRTHLLVFTETAYFMQLYELDNFVHNSECSAVRVAWQPEILCFHSHTKALEMWFKKYA